MRAEVVAKYKSTKVIPYDNSRLLDGTGKHIVTSLNIQNELSRELKLTNGNFKCPKYGQMTLHFKESDMLWIKDNNISFNKLEYYNLLVNRKTIEIILLFSSFQNIL